MRTIQTTCCKRFVNSCYIIISAVQIYLQCTDDDNKSYRNVCNMSFLSKYAMNQTPWCLQSDKENVLQGSYEVLKIMEKLVVFKYGKHFWSVSMEK